MEILSVIQKKHEGDQWGTLFAILIDMGKTVESESKQKKYYNTVYDWYGRDMSYTMPPLIFYFKLERLVCAIQKIQPKNDKLWKIYNDGLKKLTIRLKN